MKKFIVFFVLLFLATPAWADNYYCLLFSYDSKIPSPLHCHIWGTFLHVDNKGKMIEEVTISWEPNKISYTDRPRTGQHLTLQETLDFAVKKKRIIRMWGPLATNKDFFEKAKAQHQAEGQYKFLDGRHRQKSQNCIHRLSDIAGHHKTGAYWGWRATNSVYKHFRRQEVIYDTNDKSAILLLGINDYPIKRVYP